MADVEVLKKFRRNKFEKTENVLSFSSKLIAFINTYGPLCDSNYFSLILNLNNVVERYLRTEDSKVIYRLYIIYQKCNAQGKTESETFQELRSALYQLPVYTISEEKSRSDRHMHR